MSVEVVFDGASEVSDEKAPLKRDNLDAPPAKSAWSRVKGLDYVIVAGVLLLFLALSLWKNFSKTRVAAEDPISVVDPFGDVFDIDKAICELNRNGEKVFLASEAADACSVDTPVLPKGQETVVSFKTKENTEREAVVYVPSRYPSTVAGTAPRPVALMLLFHGLNDNCRRFLESTGFKPYADQDGFVIASVCGSMGYLGVGWNAGMCCGFSGEKPDDVALAQQVVQELSQALCIDKARVMSVGFSNGAMLSEVLACKAPATFRAVASVSGVAELRPGNEAGLAACTAAAATASSTARSSVLLIHGTADALVPWSGNVFLGFPPVMANLEGWRERNGCTEETNTTISTETYRNTIYAHCNVSKSAAPIGMPDEATVQSTKCCGSDCLLGVDLMKRKTASARSAKVRSSLAGGERIVSRVYPEYLRVGREHRGTTSQLTAKLRSRKARSHQRRLQAVEQMKVLKTEKATTSGHRKDIHGSREGKTFHFSRGQWLQETHHICADDTHSRLHQPVSGTVIKENWDVPKLHNVTLLGPIGTSQVELVRVNGGGHRWPRDKEFSTTDYIYIFGMRIFGSYS